MPDKGFGAHRREHDPLAGALADGPFGRALDLAIQRSELSLEHIQREVRARGLQLDADTLSHWRVSAPRDAQVRPEIAALESVLGLPTGSLAALLADEDPADPSTDLALLRGRVKRPRLERLVVQEDYFLGAGFRHELLRAREVVRSKRDGVTRGFFYYHADDNTVPLPRIVPGGGCRLGRLRTDPTAGILLAELMLERPLAEGEIAVLDYELQFDHPRPATHHERRLPLGARDYLLQVHFDPAALPADCTGYLRPDQGGSTEQQLWLGRYHTCHLVAPNPQPGNYGIRWTTS
ncbi:hypothetical protein JOF53_003133 [Crossiella equi]|uniref:Uncharacterized protein n=1 Tax=Crossiella equi TaxID=130796 RepID=A0ABS5AD34_9PSEU|nr:hypothetical protein [Crossiella equi]MBP2474261.1 hypothetical protein [Crossiella equi]